MTILIYLLHSLSLAKPETKYREKGRREIHIKMHCQSLTVPRTDSLLHLSTATTTKRSSSRVSLTRRSSFGSIRAESAINGGSVAEASQPSFYELLGIPETGSLVEIKQAYKHLARKYHPDVSPPDRVHEYTRTFIRVQEAYETLSDPTRRALYDSDMAGGLHLAFSARRRYRADEELQRGEWRNQWQSQLSELQRRAVKKDVGGNMSWAARMRIQRNESSSSES